MIGIVDVEVQAENPSLPLYPLRAYVNSPSSVRVRNVPKKIGNWKITTVYFTVNYPDSSLKSVVCTQVGGVYVATVEGSTLPGKSYFGYSITADGIDENGNSVTGYVLGKGDVEILDADGEIIPGETTYYVHLLDEPGEHEGDLFPTENGYMIFQDGEPQPLGGTSFTPEDVSVINDLIGKEKTVIEFYEGGVSAYNWTGELSEEKLIEAGIKNIYQEWLLHPTRVTIGNGVTSIGEHAFEYCETLSDMTIPNSVTSIGDGAIHSCSMLTKITIPDSVTSIGFQAFAYSNDSPDIQQTSLTIPNSVKSIGERAFLGCSAISSITIPNSVTDIGRAAFYGLDNLTELTIPGSLKEIRNRTFGRMQSLSSVTICDGVENIGDEAFWGDVEVSTLTIPASVTSVDASAFSNCVELTSVTFLEKTFQEVSSMAGFPFGVASAAIHVSNNATQEWVESKNYISSVPDTYKTYSDTLSSLSNDGYVATTQLSTKQDKLTTAQLSAIDLDAEAIYTLFYVDGESQPYKILASNTMAKTDFESVGVYDSATGTWLKNINSMRAGTNVTQLATGLFSNVYTLRYFDGPNVTWPAATVFSGCSSLTSITLPKLTNLGIQCFKECTALRKMTIPSTMGNAVGRNAFLSCADLSVTFEEKTLAEVQAMSNYPWGLTTSNITASKTATQEWVGQQGYITSSYPVKNDGGVANAKAMTQQAYDALQTKDSTTLYVITEN